MDNIKSDDIIKVPYHQFEMLMMACCLQNDCENKSSCRCREILIDNPPPTINYE